MKKIIISAIAIALVSSVFAATVPWSSSALSFGGTDLKKDTSVVGYVIYLSSGSLAASYDFTNFDASSIGTIVSTDSDGTSKACAVSGTASLPSGTYVNGDSFALLVKYTSGDATYWNLSSTVNTLSGLDPSDTTVAPADWSDFSVNVATAGEKTALTAGAGWTMAAAVPEPATGALALAGIALLLKRRKAAKA